MIRRGIRSTDEIKLAVVTTGHPFDTDSNGGKL